MTFEEAQELVMDYIRARKWDKTNDSRGLAISLSLEANELSPKRLLQKLPSKPKNIRLRFLRLKIKPSKIAAG